MNAVDEHGILVPPGAPHRRAKASVIAPDPLAVTKYGVSKYWGVTWDRKGRVWRAQYTDGDGKRKSVGRYGNEEEAALPIMTRSARLGLEGIRKVKPIGRRETRLKPPLGTRRPPSSRSTGRDLGAQAERQCARVCSTGGTVGTRRWRATIMMRTPSSATSALRRSGGRRARGDKAIIDAGLAGVRRMNEIDADGARAPAVGRGRRLLE